MISTMKRMKHIINSKEVLIDKMCIIDDKQIEINALKWLKKNDS